MSGRREYLRLRREYLVSQAAAQRSEVAWLAGNLQRRLRVADVALAAARSPLILPVLGVGAALLLRRTPRKRILSWSGRLFAAWRLFRMMRRRFSSPPG
ncbi:MAG: hypothetical protein IPK65_08350 [Gammaproteobacteria bacterium]|nr:hypothetical protein [Gammaproteobacteria bacterium]